MRVDFKTGAFYCGDNAQILDTCGQVDLVITSPPYDSLRSYNGMEPFTFSVFENLAPKIVQVLNPGGVLVWNVNDATVDGSETGSSFRQALYFKDICGLNLHDTMIFEKAGTGAAGSNYAYWQSFEYIVCFIQRKT